MASTDAYASWGQRFAAALIDGLVIFSGTLALAFFVGLLIAGGADGAGLASVLVALALFLLVSFAYAPVLLARSGECNGQTLGKQAMGIRVRHVSGGPVSFGRAVLREIVMRQLVIGWVGSFVLLPLADVLWPLWEPQSRALHDLAAATIVTRDPV